LGLILKKAGLKKTLLIGTGFEIARFAFFLIPDNKYLLFSGISLHGLTYAYFFVPATIFLDNRCTRYSRSGAHQLFSIITGGIGGFAGNLLVVIQLIIRCILCITRLILQYSGLYHSFFP
ncbi:MAG: nucleoside permease, partial [Fibrobacter sp.]|nr:nucleoside permease [Fibrobacter sp.]